jgi:hypothetical protein
MLTSAPILTIADPNKDIMVCIDACKEGMGGVLSQNDALSRRVHELHATTISMYRIDIKGRILEAANADL